MKTWEKIVLIISSSVFISSFRFLFFRSTGFPRNFHIGAMFLSVLVIYLIYLKNKDYVLQLSGIDFKKISLGIFLIVGDISYNVFTANPFRIFDYGVLVGGLFIVCINTNLFKFLKLDLETKSFLSYFIFSLILFSAFLWVLIPLILGPKNIVYLYFTRFGVFMVSFLLNFIKPTTISSDYEPTIDFDGFIVLMGVDCSGIDSITVFLAAAISYFISTKERNLKKIGIYTVIGVVVLFFLNKIRIMIIVLVGYYLGTPKMLIVHTHSGWIMFTLGMFLFWYLVIQEKEVTGRKKSNIDI